MRRRRTSREDVRGARDGRPERELALHIVAAQCLSMRGKRDAETRAERAAGAGRQRQNPCGAARNVRATAAKGPRSGKDDAQETV
jgi:hypothetical protein